MMDLMGVGRIIIICFVTGFAAGSGFGIAYYILKKFNLF